MKQFLEDNLKSIVGSSSLPCGLQLSCLERFEISIGIDRYLRMEMAPCNGYNAKCEGVNFCPSVGFLRRICKYLSLQKLSCCENKILYILLSFNRSISGKLSVVSFVYFIRFVLF